MPSGREREALLNIGTSSIPAGFTENLTLLKVFSKLLRVLSDLYATLMNVSQANQNLKKELMKTEVSNLVNYSAKRILDQFMSGQPIDVSISYDVKEMFAELKKGVTRDIIFENTEEFNKTLNSVVHKRIDYLNSEGFLIQHGSCFRMKTEQELAEFVDEDEDDSEVF